MRRWLLFAAIWTAIIWPIWLIMSLGTPALPDAGVEAWMGFIGSLIGSAVTVAAAIIAIEWQRRRNNRATRRLLFDAIGDVVDPLAVIYAYETSGWRPEAAGYDAVYQIDRLSAALTWLRRVVEWHPPQDIPTMRAYQAILRIPDLEIERLRKIAERASDDPTQFRRLSAVTLRMRERLNRVHDDLA